MSAEDAWLKVCNLLLHNLTIFSGFYRSTFVYGRFFPQTFSFFTFCLFYCLREVSPCRVWKCCLQIAGKSISNTFSNYRNIACTLLINMIFFFREYYGLVINLHKIDHTGPYSTGYQRNGNCLCIVNEHGQNNYKRLVPDLQDRPQNYVGLLSPDQK